jgi:hypothetical protein
LEPADEAYEGNMPWLAVVAYGRTGSAGWEDKVSGSGEVEDGVAGLVSI